MKHQDYENGKTVSKTVDKVNVEIKVSAVGSRPKLVQADWVTPTNGKKGTAYGGFQFSKDFDFQTAAALAIENAVAQVGA